jgi:hypothetical protein
MSLEIIAEVLVDSLPLTSPMVPLPSRLLEAPKGHLLYGRRHQPVLVFVPGHAGHSARLLVGGLIRRLVLCLIYYRPAGDLFAGNQHSRSLVLGQWICGKVFLDPLSATIRY